MSRARAASWALPLLVALALAAPGPAAAGDPSARTDDPAVSDVWARATPAGAKMGAIYLTIESAAGDRLLGAAVPRSVAGKTQVHETVMIADSSAGGGSRMAMREVEAVALPPGEAVRFQPGGYHVMLLDLKRPLREGARVPLTLRFEKAGKRNVVATVRVG